MNEGKEKNKNKNEKEEKEEEGGRGSVSVKFNHLIIKSLYGREWQETQEEQRNTTL